MYVCQYYDVCSQDLCQKHLPGSIYMGEIVTFQRSIKIWERHFTNTYFAISKHKAFLKKV